MGDRNKNLEDPITWTQDIRKTKFDLVVFFGSPFKCDVSQAPARAHVPLFPGNLYIIRKTATMMLVILVLIYIYRVAMLATGTRGQV
jgi:hypothetical protein